MLLAMVQETDPAVRYTAADGLDHTAMHLLGGKRLGQPLTTGRELVVDGKFNRIGVDSPYGEKLEKGRPNGGDEYYAT